MKQIGLLIALPWNVFLIGGCSYLVFWQHHSAWWFLLAVVLTWHPESKGDKE